MSTIKKYIKYILLIIAGMVLTNVLSFIGLNANYKNISLIGELPSSISIEKAEATSTDGRIYGYVSNNDESDINGKYIKVIVYNSKEEILETQYLKITDVEANDKRMFQARFNADNVRSYSIEIVDQENT